MKSKVTENGSINSNSIRIVVPSIGFTELLIPGAYPGSRPSYFVNTNTIIRKDIKKCQEKNLGYGSVTIQERDLNLVEEDLASPLNLKNAGVQ